MKSKILVIGGNGQLGSELEALSGNSGFEFLFIDIDELNLIERAPVLEFFAGNKFDYVINCAAYTNVEKAEIEKEAAYSVNVTAVENLVEAALKYNWKLIHISTDFVFDGSKNTPYTENDSTNPVNYYGKTKLMGENIILNKLQNALVLRTSWLYSCFGNNFVKTMLRLSESKNEISVVYDQIGTPTYAYDLAKVVLTIIEQKPDLNGIYNYSNEGIASWYDFAFRIFKITNKEIILKPIKSESFPTLAKRPNYSVLDKSKIKDALGLANNYWADSLSLCIKRMEK